MAMECYNFFMPGAADTPVLPDVAAAHRSDYRSMRKIDVGETPTLVIQISDSVGITFVVTANILVLLP